MAKPRLTLEMLNNIIPLLSSQDKDMKTMGKVMLLDVDINDYTTKTILKTCCVINNIPRSISTSIQKKIYGKTMPLFSILNELQTEANSELINYIIKHRI